MRGYYGKGVSIVPYIGGAICITCGQRETFEVFWYLDSRLILMKPFRKDGMWDREDILYTNVDFSEFSSFCEFDDKGNITYCNADKVNCFVDRLLKLKAFV
jgi:hypothetical protein